MVAETFDQFFQHGLCQLGCFFLAGRFGCHTKVHLTDLGVGGNRGIGLIVDEVADFIFHKALTQAADPYHRGVDDLRLQFIQIIVYLSLKHRDQLSRRAWQKDDGLAVLLHDDARGRTVLIVQNDGSLGNQGLLPVVVGDDLVLAVLKILLDPLSGMWILLEGYAHHLSCGLLCQVVLCRAKTAGKDHHIRTI